VTLITETAAELFYGRLFELDPSLRKLFKGDMKEQGLGNAFTDEVRAAWTNVYMLLAGVMIDAARAKAA